MASGNRVAECLLPPFPKAVNVLGNRSLAAKAELTGRTAELSLEAFGEGMAAVYAQLGGEAKIESARETTLQDGVTEAMEFIVEWSASPYLSCFSLPASFRFDGKGSDEPRRAHS